MVRNGPNSDEEQILLDWLVVMLHHKNDFHLAQFFRQR